MEVQFLGEVGRSAILVDDADTRLLDTGDCHTGSRRLVSASTARRAADAVVCESTYADAT
jgi:putative mRNA 3-end processing factor